MKPALTFPAPAGRAATRSTRLREAVKALQAAAAALRAAGYPPDAAVLREIDATVAIESQRLAPRLRWRRAGTVVTRRGLRITWETHDGHFRIAWEDRQGARSGWAVRDILGERTLRAGSLNEAKETAMEMALARAAEPEEAAS